MLRVRRERGREGTSLAAHPALSPQLDSVYICDGHCMEYCRSVSPCQVEVRVTRASGVRIALGGTVGWGLLLLKVRMRGRAMQRKVVKVDWMGGVVTRTMWVESGIV